MRFILSVRRTAVLLAAVLFALVFGLRSAVPAVADSFTLSGTVLTPNGEVYTGGGGADLNNSAHHYNSGIESNGHFEFTGVEPGTYTLSASVPNSSVYANAVQQSVTLTASVTNFEIRVSNPVIRGTLAKPDGTPTSGCVNARNSTWTVNQGSCPGDDGAFKIGGLPAGAYIFETSVPDNSPYVGSDRTVTVTDPSVALDLGVVKFENPFIVGKVALPDGTIIPWNDDWNQRVHLSVDMWNSDWTINKHSNYDNQGQFKFGRVPAGAYTLHVNVWDTELYTGSANVALTVPEGGLNLTASPVRLSTPQLSGVVYRPNGTTPIQNAYVYLHSEDWTYNQGSSTDANGKYRIGGLPAGTYKLEVSPPQDMNDIVRPDAVDMTITTGLTTKNITLSTAKKFVTGTVKMKDGSAVTCANVNASRRGGNGWANTQTKSDGTYIMTLAPGAWNIRVEPNRSFDCPEANWVYLEPEAIAEFTEDNTSQVIVANFTVQKATAIITGTVKKADGTLVTNGNVNANSQTRDGRSRWANAQIKADGSYKLYLVGGTYDLNVWTPDNRLFTRNQKVSVADNQTVAASFTMSEKAAHITGRVTNKSGLGLSNIQINGNLDCGPNGCAAWSNTKTDADGYFDLAATAGRWFINFDSGQNTTYVYDGQPVDVYVPSETATVSNVNFALTYADVLIQGKVVDDNGQAFSDFSGWAYVRPGTATSDLGYREFGGSVNQGTFSFRVPSSLFSRGEIGVHVPPNSKYSSVPGQTVTLVADSTVTQNIVVKQNDAAVFGRVVDSTGMPLQNCSFRGEVFVNTQNGQWYGTQINPDCSYEIALLAGTYNLGYNIDQSAGFMNRPPSNNQLTVSAGTRVQRDVKVLAGDARVSILVLNPDGTPARRVWVWADNHEEVDQQRRMAEQGQGGDNFRGPGGTTSPEELFKYCAKPENEKECKDFKLPPGSEGPGGCKDALACAKYCAKNKKQCQEAIAGKKTSGAASAQSVSVRGQRMSISSLKVVQAQGESKEETDSFDNMLNSGTESNDVGVATLSLLSGHEYTVNAGLPPDSKYMPPKTTRVNLNDTKSAAITLQLREADGRLSGFVTWNGVAVSNGWVSCWSEDGNSNGSPIVNGTYGINYTANSTYHCNANASVGTSFLRSDDELVVIGKEKTKKQNFTLGEAKFQIPPPASESFDSTQPHVLTLADGTTINIPANTIASSGTVTINANPTINVQSQKTAQPLGYGYSFEAVDANNQIVTKFNGNITMCFKYTDAQLEDNGIEENSLVPSYWDATAGTWKQPANVTHNTENNTICVTSDHFTSYAVVGASGNARGRSLQPVTVKQIRGVTQITMGSGAKAKKVKPFSDYRGSVLVGTTNIGKSGQIVVAVQGDQSSGPTTLKVYSMNGKLQQQKVLWGKTYRSGAATLDISDVTKNGWDDVIVSPLNERSVKIYDFAKKSSYSVNIGSRGRIIARGVDLQRTGSDQLVVSLGTSVRAWSFGRRSFSPFSFDGRKVRVQGDSIERVILQPEISSVTPSTVKSGKGLTTIVIRGRNFGSGTRVVLDNGTTAKKVVAVGNDVLKVTIDRSKYSRNTKRVLIIANADGGQAEYRWLKVK